MKRIIMYWYLLLASLEMMSLISVTANRPFTSYALASSHQAQNPGFPQASSDSKQKADDEVVSGTVEGTCAVLRRLGSRPPSRGYKCQVCIPCNAIQKPAAISGQIGLYYSNYESEGWKSKCGSSFLGEKAFLTEDNRIV